MNKLAYNWIYTSVSESWKKSSCLGSFIENVTEKIKVSSFS